MTSKSSTRQQVSQRKDGWRLVEELGDLDDLPIEPSDSLPEKILLAAAMRLITDKFGQNTLTSDEIEQIITDAAWVPGAQGDGGLDAYWEDESSRTFWLIQSKYSADPAATIPRKELSDMFRLPNTLLEPEALLRIRNERVREAGLDLKERLRDGYGLTVALVTTCDIDKRIRGQARRWGENEIGIAGLIDRSEDPSHEFQIFDFKSLKAIFEERTGREEISTTLTLSRVGHIHHLDAHVNFLIGLLDGTELARLYKQYKKDLFRDNPRGVLGNVQVNKNIAQSLVDPEQRKVFHLLNNGISATCSTLKMHEHSPLHDQDAELRVDLKDFQIVNGLQTTYTIWDRYSRQESLDGCRVVIKIVEGSDYREAVSLASNSQNAMTGWDFASQDPQQKRLQSEFDQLGPTFPYFYEIRRGKFLGRASPATSRKKIRVKEIAQAALAFTGKPVEAKDKLRLVANQVVTHGDDYSRLFNEDTRAAHLAIPWLVRMRVYESFKRLEATYAKEEKTPPLWLGDARFHAIWLIGIGFNQRYKVDSVLELSSEGALSALQEIDSWIEPLLQKARQTIQFVFALMEQTAQLTNTAFRPRQVFKTADPLSYFKTQMISELLDPVEN